MAPCLFKGLRRGSSNISTPILGGTSTDGVSRWTKKTFSTISALQSQITAPSNEPTAICEGMVAGVSHGTKRGPSTISAPQSQVNNGVSHMTKKGPYTISAPQSQINNGASREKKRGSSTVSALQPQINPTSPDPTILTSVGNSINGVHKRSSRRVSAVSAPQSQMFMSSEPTTLISDETSTGGASKLFKKARGKTRCLASECALHAAGGKLSVTIKVEDCRPSGANSRFFVTEIGFIVRTFAPLQYECFGNIPDQEKESLVFRLLTKYDVDTSKPHVMHFIYTVMSKRYTEFRNKLKGYFLTFANAEEARKYRPDNVEKQGDWNYICDLFTTNAKYKSRSAKNTINRSKLFFNHCGGSKFFVNYQYEVSSEDEDEYGDDEEWMENVVQKGPRGPIEVFHKTHYNDTNDHYNDTNGWTSKLAEARYNEMIALQNEQEGLDEAKRLSEKEICAKVLGKRSVCAFSFKPTTREDELEAENEQLKLELQEMKPTMTSVKDMQKVINQLQDFQKCIEGASPSTPSDAYMD